MHERDNDVEGQGSHVELFVYRVPKVNHDKMLEVEKKLTQLYQNHGMVGSEFYALTSERVFADFTNIGKAIGASPDEEVWVEIERYRDLEHRNSVVNEIAKDSEAGPLFERAYGTSGAARATISGELDRLLV